MKPWEADQSQVENGLLAAVLREPANWLHLQSLNLAPSDWLHAKPLYETLANYQRQYHKMPPLEWVSANFADWRPPTGDYAFWVDQMRRCTIGRRMQKSILETLEHMDDPEQALPQLIRSLGAIQTTGNSNAISVDGSIAMRVEKYQLRRELYQASGGKHIIGMRTMWDSLNQHQIGWLPGELIGLYSRPTVGKSWVLAQECVTSWMQGKRVLFLSPEMPASQISMRFDALMASLFSIPWSYKAAMVGNPAMEPSYHALAERIGSEQRWWVIDSVDGQAIGLPQISYLIERHQPDMVYIDGLSLLAGYPNKQEWERVKNISYDLKMLATTRGTPIMVTHQAVNTRRGARDDQTKRGVAPRGDGAIGRSDDWSMPSLNDSAFGDAFVQACNSIITMCADRERSDIRWYSFRKLRDRETDWLKPRYPLLFNVDAGEIADLWAVPDLLAFLATRRHNRAAVG